jgi:hypothetical protein
MAAIVTLVGVVVSVVAGVAGKALIEFSDNHREVVVVHVVVENAQAAMQRSEPVGPPKARR